MSDIKLDGIREKVFLDRYALKDKDGSLLEHAPEEMWARVARGIAKQEKPANRKVWEKKFYDKYRDWETTQNIVTGKQLRIS